MAFPCARERFVMESGDLAQSRWPGDCRDVLPLLVSLKNLLRHRGTLPVNAPTVEDPLHAEFDECHRCHVKRTRCERGLTLRQTAGRAGPGRLLLRP